MAKRIISKPGKLTLKQPTIADLGKQLEKIDCYHLVGKEVIEQQIADLARGKLDKSYCQNWDRCGNGWGKCSPDSRRWLGKIRELDLIKVLSAKEITILEKLKMQIKR